MDATASLLDSRGSCVGSGLARCMLRVACARCLGVGRTHRGECGWERLLRRSSCALLDAQGIRYDVAPNAWLDGRFTAPAKLLYAMYYMYLESLAGDDF